MLSQDELVHLGIALADALHDCKGPEQRAGVLKARHAITDLLHEGKLVSNSNGALQAIRRFDYALGGRLDDLEPLGTMKRTEVL